jgi:hypothetical protein
MSSWGARSFSYDDEPCPKRQLGLNHVLKSGECVECGIALWPASMKLNASAQAHPGPRPTKDVCQFATCEAKITICNWLTLWRTLEDGTSILEDEKVDTWMCFEHSDAVKSTKKRLMKVRRSFEGWVWIDNLDHIRFAT